MRWSRIADAPVAGRAQAHALGTDEGLVVWDGVGEDEARRSVPFLDGAQYDLAGAAWRLIPPAPLAPRLGAAVAYVPDSLFIWGGLPHPAQPDGQPADLEPLSDGAIWNRYSNEWLPVGRAPLRPRMSAVTFLAGRDLIVWGGVSGPWIGEAAPAAFNDGARYDTRANTWRPIAECLLPARLYPVAVWAADKLLVFGGYRHLRSHARLETVYPPAADASMSIEWQSGTEQWAEEAVVYDATTDAWSEILAPARVDESMRFLALGELLLGLRLDGRGFVWSLATGDVRDIATLPAGSAALQRQVACLAVNDTVVVISEPLDDDVAAAREGRLVGWFWTIGADRWEPLPPIPLSTRKGVATATSDEALLLWGGVSPGRGSVPLFFHRDGATLHMGGRGRVS